MSGPHSLANRLVAGFGTPIGVPEIFWGVCQGAPSGSGATKTISVKVNGSGTAITMAFDSGYAAGTAPATNDVVWGWVVGSDYLVVGTRVPGGGGTGVVTSVNGNTGAVVITATGLGAELTANKGVANGYAGLDAGSLVPAANSRVQSVAGRTGAVTLAAADVSGVEATANKGAANGYAGLGAGSLVPQAQLGSGSAGAGAKFLADDQTYKTPTATVTFSGVRVRNSADQNVATTTITALTFDTNVIISTAGYHSTVTNTSRLVAQTTGKHKVYVSETATEVSTTGVQRKVEIYVNGTLIQDIMGGCGPRVGVYLPFNGSLTLDLTAGDFVEAKGYQDSGATMAYAGGVGLSCFGMELIGT